MGDDVRKSDATVAIENQIATVEEQEKSIRKRKNELRRRLADSQYKDYIADLEEKYKRLRSDQDLVRDFFGANADVAKRFKQYCEMRSTNTESSSVTRTE